MEFGMKKCGILNKKRGKLVRWEGIKLLNCEVIKEIEKKGYTYFCIVELDKIKENEMKKENEKKNNKGI